MTATLEVLGQNKKASYNGDFVFGLDSTSGKGTATDKGFGHVHKHWYNQTRSYDEGFEQLAQGKAETEDIVCKLTDMVPTTDSAGNLVFQYVDGRQFKPTPHALAQAGTKFLCGTTYPDILFNRGAKGDGAALAFALEHGKQVLMDTIKDSKRMQTEYLFRTRKDGSLRAVLTAGYAIIDNRWYLDIVKKTIPGGRLSHWRGDADTIFGNVLIPDTIREESDSDYGGMVSIGNCEIGIRVMSNQPSVFRAICMNGCIWDQELGKAIRQVHRGKLNLDDLEKRLVENIEGQIPLLPAGIQRMLGIRAYSSDVNIKPLVGQVALDYKFSKSQASAILKAYGEESTLVPEYRGTLFNLVNAVTRAGQTFGNSDWLRADTVAGEMVSFERNDWDSLTTRASKLKAEKVDELFAVAV